MPRIPAALAAVAVVALCIGFNTGRYPVVREMAADVLDSRNSSSTATQTAEISPSPQQPAVNADHDQPVISDAGGSGRKPADSKSASGGYESEPAPQPKSEATAEPSPQSASPDSESEPSKPAPPSSESQSEPTLSKPRPKLAGTTCSISSGPVETPDAQHGLPPTEKTSTGGDASDKGEGPVAGGDKPAEAGKTSTGGDAPDKGTDAIAHGDKPTEAESNSTVADARDKGAGLVAGGDKPAEAEKTSTGGDAPDKGAGLIAGGEQPAEAEGKSTVADASDKSTGLHTPSDPQLPDRPPQPLTSSSDGAAPLAKETPKPSQSAVEQSSPEKKLVRRLPPIEQEVSSASNVGLDALPDGDIP
ncbi:MAG: hypothetical protein ACLQNE_15205, partial [Thermoguttaceae bacterium]